MDATTKWQPADRSEVDHLNERLRDAFRSEVVPSVRPSAGPEAFGGARTDDYLRIKRVLDEQQLLYIDGRGSDGDADKHDRAYKLPSGRIVNLQVAEPPEFNTNLGWLADKEEPR